jgi:two-component system cell cycle response regulator CpdR
VSPPVVKHLWTIGVFLWTGRLVHPRFTDYALQCPSNAADFSGKQTDMARILLAEDDDSLRGFLARALERAGFEVQACADGEEAVQHLERPWDLLLTDIVMPGMDGIEVARQAAARDPSLRIMFITGFAAVALSAQDRAPAGAKVLSKPVHLRDLVAEVEKMMAA